MTKLEENYVFQNFQENYKNMPFGTAIFEDKPDVIFTTLTGEVIGIELTECIYSESLMKESEYQIKFNEKVIAQLEEKMPFKFHLDIDLDTKNPLKQNQISTTINEIVNVCMNEFGNLNPYESKNVEQLDVDWNQATLDVQQHFINLGYRKLPKGILRIQMSRYDVLKKSRHPESKGGVVPNFTADILESILNKKNKALLNYKYCDQHWLVISEGGDFYSQIDKVNIEKEFETKFDKIFMYRRWEKEVIVIK